LAELETILAEHEKPLLRFAAGFLRDHSLAQDAVQEAFVSLARQKTMPVGGHLRNWLFMATRNKAFDILRSEKRRLWLHNKAASEAAADSSVSGVHAEENEDAEKLRMVEAALPKLNPARREVLLLRLQQGLPHEQIAEITGHSPGHCRKLLHEAVEQLKKIIGINS